MKKLFFILMSVCQMGYSQSVSRSQISVPDSVKQICDKLFLDNAGEQIFRTCIRFDSSGGTKRVYENGEMRFDYTIYYTFSFPDVKEATFPLSMNYAVYSGTAHVQSGRFLRVNQTDLPEDIKGKGVKIITVEEARDIAVKADSLMLHANCNFVLGQNTFYWQFVAYENNPDPKGEMDQVISHNVIVDPYSGKVTASFIK